MALMAISAGSSTGLTHLRRIMMLVSSSPRWWLSPVIGSARFVVQRCVLVGPERADVDGGRAPGHGGEFLARHEPPAAPQRDQLADPVPVAGDGERLPVLHGVHDLLGPVAEISLSDLRLRCHASQLNPCIAPCATRCYTSSRCRIAQISGLPKNELGCRNGGSVVS